MVRTSTHCSCHNTFECEATVSRSQGKNGEAGKLGGLGPQDGQLGAGRASGETDPPSSSKGCKDMLTNRRRMTLAGLTVALTAFSMMLVASSPQADASHIPDTGPIPANCVEFQVGVTGPKTVLGVTITVNSWTNTPGDPHTVSFTITGLTEGQTVDISVKSGNNPAQEASYGNGTHSFSNGLQNAISHIRLCVFTSTTTTTVDDTTTTTVDDTTTTTVDDTTTTTVDDTTTTTVDDTTTTTVDDTTTTTVDDTTTTTVDDTTTTTVDDTTTTTAGDTTTTGDPGTTSTIPDEVLPTVVTSTTLGDEVLGTTIVAGELPFTGFDDETLGPLALVIVVLGVLTLLVAKSISARSNEES